MSRTAPCLPGISQRGGLLGVPARKRWR